MSNAEHLLERARAAAQQAHCPYSDFHVGAAVACDDGSIVEGCNVENASYAWMLKTIRRSRHECPAELAGR